MKSGFGSLLGPIQGRVNTFFCLKAPYLSTAFETIEPGTNRSEGVVNHSMQGAERTTHLKIVAVGLVCAIVVAVVGIFAHIRSIDLGTAPLVKAGQPTTLSGSTPTIR